MILCLRLTIGLGRHILMDQRDKSVDHGDNPEGP
jgi:hypothetical protein